MAEDDLRSAGISPRERLERIETMLSRIDEKLDTKADAVMVASLSARISAIELAAAVVTNQTTTLANDVRDKLDARVSALQKEHQVLNTKLTWFAGAVAAVITAAPFVWQLIFK